MYWRCCLWMFYGRHFNKTSDKCFNVQQMMILRTCFTLCHRSKEETNYEMQFSSMPEEHPYQGMTWTWQSENLKPNSTKTWIVCHFQNLLLMWKTYVIKLFLKELYFYIHYINTLITKINLVLMYTKEIFENFVWPICTIEQASHCFMFRCFSCNVLDSMNQKRFGILQNKLIWPLNREYRSYDIANYYFYFTF